MQTIKYRFADGTTSEIEVTDKFYALYAELVQQEKRNQPLERNAAAYFIKLPYGERHRF